MYEAITSAGLDGTYYSLRDLAAYANGKPAKTTEHTSLSRQQLASDKFLQESTTLLDNGNRTVLLAIDGLTCAACGWLVEQVATKQRGMQEASVNLPDASLHLEFDPDEASLPFLLDELGRFGYEVHPRKARQDGASPLEKKLLTKVGVSWALAGNVMLLTFALYSGLTLENDTALAAAARWASFLLTTITVAYGGSVFFRTAMGSIKMAVQNRSFRRLHIDTPISLGILGGYLNSGWATVTGSGELWFDSISVLIAALLTARWLQVRSQRTATQAATRLLDMVPSTARRLLAGGQEEYVDSDSIEPGDTIQVNPGEVVPVDGQVLSGQSTLNNAVITGESAPVRIGPGQNVYAGCLNQSSPLVIRVDRSGNTTRVGKLLEWLEQSRHSRAPVVELTDRIAGLFVIGIIVAAIGTAVVGLFMFPDSAVNRVVALLVISCPCALGMATPLAIAAANGRAARRGIYIKDGAIVEALTRVQTVVFDKTGTLTEGNLSVVEFSGSDHAFAVGARLERFSDHPIAKAIDSAANHWDQASTTFVVEDVDSVSGHGIRGSVDGKKVAVGKPEWIESFASATGHFQDDVERFAEVGLTPVCIAIENRVAGVIGCGDQIRPESADEIRRLKDQGVRVVLLSGDHEKVARIVALQVGIAAADTFGNVGPEEKRAFIEELERSGAVMMVGDGANDAAALRTASVGIAVGNSNVPCLVASDVFVPREGAVQVGMLLTFGDRVMRLIKKNLAVSLAYNLVAGVAAILGFVTPLVAAVAMPLSSLFVVTTSIASNPFAREMRTDGQAGLVNPHEALLAGESVQRRATESRPGAGSSVAIDDIVAVSVSGESR